MVNDRDAAIMAWVAAKAALDQATAAEWAARLRVVEAAFPAPSEGVNRVELGMGYAIKLDAKFNYSLDNKNGKVESALQHIEGMGEAGKIAAGKIISSWKPNLSVTAYRALPSDIKPYIDNVLTIKPAAPALEFITPEKKK